jgi:hypothetical protein
MIDVRAEQLLRLQKARDVIPPRRNDTKVSLATLHRWITHGVRGVRLEVVKVGGMTYTSDEAIARFIAAVSAVGSHGPTAATDASSTVRARSKRVIKAAADAKAALYPEPKRPARGHSTAASGCGLK